MTPAQRYAFKFRSWYCQRIDFMATPYPFGRPPQAAQSRSAAREHDWPWTHYERASTAAYGRLSGPGA